MDQKTLGAELAKLGLPLLGAALPVAGGMALGAALASTIDAPSAQPDDILATLNGNAQALAQAKQFELTHQQAMLKLTMDAQTALLRAEASDQQDARQRAVSLDALWWIAALVLITFAVIMAAVLVGSWRLLQWGITIKDVSAVAAISGLVGSIVGYVAANAHTVINFLFGGSMGNEKNSAALAESVRTSTQALAMGNGANWRLGRATMAARPAVVEDAVGDADVAATVVEQEYGLAPGGQGEVYRGS
ncbi:hypothetical protein [Paraburkholderia antibiotica]|uniref:Uncharacterized protein n=1 Tax=Paraburkholderia antibiotica TaxID=2728839 RepID=A0A7X9X7Q4_9BURK|nr:hypothetical protein [Paraburkholderia antibiotica]NML32975.1 hypothetical protein [Paraburkholderia antibiotica]